MLLHITLHQPHAEDQAKLQQARARYLLGPLCLGKLLLSRAQNVSQRLRLRLLLLSDLLDRRNLIVFLWTCWLGAGMNQVRFRQPN